MRCGSSLGKGGGGEWGGEKLGEREGEGKGPFPWALVRCVYLFSKAFNSCICMLLETIVHGYQKSCHASL
jgi:hypothetical protein